MSYFRAADYSQVRTRPNLFSNYLEKMTRYLKLQHPNHSEDEIQDFIKKIVRERAKSPIVEAVVHKREGFSDQVVMRLDKFITEIIKDNNLSPSGSCYLPITKKESFLRKSIEAKIKERKDFKNLYLDFEAQGKKREAQYYYQKQANAKIFNNAIAGGMRIKQFILGSLAGFNAITSVGRMSVKQGYSFIERMINGNIYLPTARDAVSYILNHILHIPNDFVRLMESGKLYVPTQDDVLKYLVSSVGNYVSTPDENFINRTLRNLTPIELSYVFYAGCFSNLCRYNDAMMRKLIDDCYLPADIDPVLYQDIDPSTIKSFHDDILACMLQVNYWRLGRNPKKPDRWNSLKDAAKFNPEGLKAFIYACQYFVTQFDKLIPILKPIIQIETTFSRMTLQHRMARYTVPLSDTDSNIFSTQELIRWKRGRIDFTQEAYEMNALTTLIISQSLEHVFARLSSGYGIDKKDVFRISMKNEFLYPVVIATTLAKHYLAIATMQEGSLLPNPRKDIKGVGFRSSAYPKPIREGFDQFVVDLFATIKEGDPIRATTVLDHVANTERMINQSVLECESTYLSTVSIKRKEDYADPMSSVYFYYELWRDVFAKEYGEMTVPNKCYKIPLKGGKKLFRDPAFLEDLKKRYPKIHRNLIAFMEKYPKRDITYLLVPPSKGKVHKLFIEILDTRLQVSQAMTAYYHLLDSLGIGTIDKDRTDGLVCDFYEPSKPTIV